MGLFKKRFILLLGTIAALMLAAVMIGAAGAASKPTASAKAEKAGSSLGVFARRERADRRLLPERRVRRTPRP